VAEAAKRALGGQQQGVGSDGEGGGGLHRADATDLRLTGAEQSFLFAKGDFDVPAMKVSFDGELGFWVFIRSGEKSGATIKQLGTLARAISEGGDDNELQRLAGANGVPHQSLATLEAQFARRSSRTAQTGAGAGSSASTARRTREKMVSTGRRRWEKSR
jgi:hypothetical protein